MATQGRTIPVNKDLMYQARKQYPGYDDQAALTLLMLDKFTEQEKTDTDQSRLINLQRSENEKLKGALGNLGRELDQLEQESVSNDNEIERLKQLTAKLRPASELTQQATQLSAKEVARLEQELEKLRNKPGIDDKKFNELNARVQQLVKMPGVSTKDVREIEALISDLEQKNAVTSQMFASTQQKLDAKEERFKKYIEKKGQETKSQAEEIKSYASIINKYKDDIKGFGDFMNTERERMLGLRGEMQEIVNNLQSRSDELMDFMDLKARENAAQQAAQSAISTAQTSSQQGQQKPQPTQAAQPQTTVRPNLSQFDFDDEEVQDEPVDVKIKKRRNPTMPADLKEDIRPARTTGDSEYDEWFAKSLPILVKLFKKKFIKELGLKSPTYGDHQIAYAIEEFAPWLYNLETEVVTVEQMNKFLNACKVQLFRQPVEPEQFDLDLKEGLTKTYERMLDNLIGFKNL